jgi:hypothetical protein
MWDLEGSEMEESQLYFLSLKMKREGVCDREMTSDG